ncbi:hypothetical protein KY310_04655 [Candidatus Woesearchaeota archaeon]|nr:hypothetical protein [Candidatus Woesearchaeota archaeon]
MAKTLSVDEFMKTATANQKDLLNKIMVAATKEQDLAKEVNAVYAAAKPGGLHSPDGISLTVCEDEDDAKIVSLGSRMKLEETRAQIKRYMQEAVKIGMGHLGIINRNYEHYVGAPIPE